MNISELIKVLKERKAEHGDLPVMAMIDNYGDSAGEIDEANLEIDEEFPGGYLLLE